MTMKRDFDKDFIKNTYENKDDLNAKILLKFLSRNKKFISFLSILFFLLAVFYSLIKQKKWEGDFEIVLKNEKITNNLKGQLLENFGNLSNLVSLPSLTESIDTQVEILKSPSVLMPIFEKVKAKRNADKWLLPPS